MIKNQFSNISNLAIIVAIITGFDYFVNIFLVEVKSFSLPVLIILLPFSVIILFLTVRIWKIILTEESKVKFRHRNAIITTAVLSFLAGLSGFLIYLIEIILSSGILGTVYSELDLTLNLNEGGLVFLLMILTYFLKILHNTCGLIGCVLISTVWIRQFRIWARFSEAEFIKSFYFAGVAMIILLFDQLITVTLYNVLYWFIPEEKYLSNYPPIIQSILIILFIFASIILPVAIFFLAKAGQTLKIPYEKSKSNSPIAIILPLGFFLLWFITNILVLVEGSQVDMLPASLLQTFFFVIVFVPLSIGYVKSARRIESEYLRKNLNLAAVGTLILFTIEVVEMPDWTGMIILPGYLLAFSILLWSLANISQYIGSRQTLSRRLSEAGVQFLSEMGEAEMKAQSLQQMAKVMTDVSNNFMQEITQMSVNTPPTDDEIRKIILDTMGVRSSPSEAEVMNYLKDAITFVQQTGFD